MSRRARSAVFLFLMQAVVTVSAQTIRWHSSLDDVMKAGEKNSHRILIFFTGPEADLSRHYERVFTEPAVVREMAEHYEALRLELEKNRKLAGRMNIFRAGTIVLYQSNGAPIEQIDERLSADEFLRKISIRPAVSASVPRVAAQSAGAKTPRPGVLLAVTGTPPPSLPRGKLIRGPVRMDARSSATAELGILNKGTTYVLVLEGLYSIWSGAEKSADALYIFNRPGHSGQLELSTFLRFKEGNKRAYDYYREKTGSYPVYRKDHIYEVPLEGQGKKVELHLFEANERSYTDNSGEVVVTLYESGPSAR